MAGLKELKLSYAGISMALAGIITIEGLAIAANAQNVTIRGIGVIIARTWLLAGIVLALLGVLVLLVYLLPRYQPKLAERARRFLPLLPVPIGGILAIVGMLFAIYAAWTLIPSIGWVRSMWMAGFGAQLFFIGAALIALRLSASMASYRLLSRMVAFIALASIGLFIVGIADIATIQGIGTIMRSTVQLGGWQLFALSAAGLIFTLIENRPFLQRKVKGQRLGTILVVALATIICIEGLVLVGFAAPFTIRSIGGMLERTMVLAGLGLTVIGLLVPLSYFVKEKEDMEVRQLGASTSLFVLVMVPFAFLI